jgi:hypothetical protein
VKVTSVPVALNPKTSGTVTLAQGKANAAMTINAAAANEINAIR